MAEGDFSALSSLKLQYPSVPSTVVLKVINKYGSDREKCKQALDVERNNYPPEEEEPGAINSAAGYNSNYTNAESASEANSLSSRLRELQVKHPNQAVNPGERHVSTLQRAVGGNVSQAADIKKPHVGQSVSWTVQKTERQTSLSTGPSAQYVPTFQSAAPQTAPADFTSFMFASTVNDIPQIDCNAHAGRVQHASPASTSSSNSPAEQRRPVKVINIPPGSLSGGSVSIAATPPNSRHIRMHFGDTGGECTVSGLPSNLHRNHAAHNPNPHYRTELHTETTAPQPVHSSSIFVNTSNPNLPPLQAKPLTGGHSGEDRRAMNPPMTLNTSTCDNQKLIGHNGIFSSNELLSFPVQASSPGTVNSKPMFVEIKRDSLQMQDDFQNSSNQQSYFTSTIGRSMTPSASFPSHPMMSYNPMVGAHGYVSQYNPDFTSPSIYTASQGADQFTPQQQYAGYTGHHMNLYQPSLSSAVSQNLYPPFGSMYNYPGAHMGVGAQIPQYGYSPHDQPGQSATLSRVLSSSRSNSQESEHSSGAEFDPRLAFNSSHVSSHSSPSSDKSYASLGRPDQHRPRAGSGLDEADERDGYVTALLQHQKSRWQKMNEENVKFSDILSGLRKEVSDMEKSKTGSSRINSFPSAADIARLCENNRSLQTDIQMYMNELEMYKQGQVPINEMNPLAQQNFFENMPTGQQDPIYSRTPGNQRAVPPPRPPPPIPVRQPSVEPPTTRPSSGGRHFSSSSNNSDIYRVPPVPPPQPTVNSGESEEGERWNCKACTFSNFPALKECEMCGLLRDPPLSVSSPSAFSSSASGLSQCPPALPPHHPLTTLPPRLAQSLVGGGRNRSHSPSPADMFGRQHHHDHTGEPCYCHSKLYP
ncbi:TGF-beta-activated kinase 1 and MAP3K7-binding protein 2 [Elysia marginata]|uniref:TGF-beta-activated kinase 1 and MAP3K7-binding protein 2 n=1 Tax=Elysia marginata TaxID=1093978 RepID=A0AAV4I3S1_9GAST|nr:TGF-beta-activated kinase 1 and MAP3K7-binding protein 2 [Elysia marginata]